jgi:hypothetical protein
MNSWDKSDSFYDIEEDPSPINPNDFAIYRIGKNDHKLMLKLAKGGAVHAKYRRMINITCDITAPLYWWKEFDTYKVGTVANSCSTMHKIHAKEFTLDDFSHEHLIGVQGCADDWFYDQDFGEHWSATDVLDQMVLVLNFYRKKYLETKDKRYWWQMIQLLPTSYNQKRTVQLNYEVLVGLYKWRKDHKLDEWHVFCDWIKSLPYSELITMEGEE